MAEYKGQQTTMLHAIGFDLGETLIHYQGVPLSWQTLYREAMAQVAQSCAYQVEEEALAQALTIPDGLIVIEH